MNTASKILNKDYNYIANYSSVNWISLRNKSILITGATGLIGSTIVHGLVRHNQITENNIKIYIFVRNIEKAYNLFNDYIKEGWIKLIEGDICNIIFLEENIDFIIHGASETASKVFVEKPVETILTALNGTKNILDLAVKKNIKSMVYLSSMEVYGTPLDNIPLAEDHMGYLNPLSVRSSYPESKRMAENLCISYYSEHRIPVRIIRLTQTFGPGISLHDERVFAEFAKCILYSQDIILKTRGITRRMYLYVSEAVTAILTLLTRGQNGSAYNAANPDTFCSISEMAEMIAAKFGNGHIKVIYPADEMPNQNYAPAQSVYLDTSYMESLGWKAQIGLDEMYKRMIIYMEDLI